MVSGCVEGRISSMSNTRSAFYHCFFSPTSSINKGVQPVVILTFSHSSLVLASAHIDVCRKGWYNNLICIHEKAKNSVCFFGQRLVLSRGMHHVCTPTSITSTMYCMHVHRATHTHTLAQGNVNGVERATKVDWYWRETNGRLQTGHCRRNAE